MFHKVQMYNKKLMILYLSKRAEEVDYTSHNFLLLYESENAISDY